MWWVPRWQQLGFKVRPLGLPWLVDGQPTMAVCIDVSETSLASMRALGGLKAAKLTRRMIYQPQVVKIAMQPGSLFDDRIDLDAVLCPKLMRLYREQSDEGWASLLGFLHLIEDLSKVVVQLRTSSLGLLTLVMTARAPSTD